jgi:uncharacterized protein
MANRWDTTAVEEAFSLGNVHQTGRPPLMVHPETAANLVNSSNVPGIQPADVAELVELGCGVMVLSRGMELRLQVMPETLRTLEDAGIRVHVAETSAAVKLYNELTMNHRVGGLFHSTC